ncbi:MAG TPA: DUF2934 domain-containing protein [Blastocatellia bacterium]|nr:DUF2934 domain-containing protein [Blastocatellia bacterium]
MSERTNESPVENEAMSYHLSHMMYADLSACGVRELISRRAYELYKQRNGEIGDELSDWLKAEGEVVSILLAEPQETAEKETLNLSKANRTRTRKSAPKAANGAPPRVSRWSKRKNSLKANPA